MHEQLYKITGAATYIGECSQMLMNNYKKDAFAVLDTTVRPYFAQVLADYKVVAPQELTDATFFHATFAQHCTDPMFLYSSCATFAELALWSEADLHDLRQNLGYGIGVFAKLLPPDAFKSLLPKCMEALELFFSNPEAESEDVLPVTENALTSYGILALFHTKDASHVTKFLGALPLKGEAEAQEAHDFLLDQCLAKNPLLTSNPQTAATLQRIKAAAADNEDLLTEEGREKLSRVL